MTVNNCSSTPVLVVSEIFPPRVGGSGQWLHEIYRRQPSQRTVILAAEHENAVNFDAQSSMQIVRGPLSSNQWTLLNISGIRYFARLISSIYKLCKLHGCCEVHCARLIPEGVAVLILARMHKLKLVCFLHGEDVSIARSSREHRWLVQKVISRADRLVCNSRNTKQLLLENWSCNAERVRVVNPGIDTSVFKPADDVNQLRNTLGWSGRKILLTVSRLDDRKGHDRMIEALPSIIETVPELLYVIVGAGPRESNLRKMVTEATLDKYVEFRGEVSSLDMLHCYQGCHLFILPHREIQGVAEGFGIVLLEAQGCAKPVIAGFSGGTAETMSIDETGWIIDCADSSNIVEPVSRLLTDEVLAQKMGLRARALMVECFDWERLTQASANAVFLDAELP